MCFDRILSIILILFILDIRISFSQEIIDLEDYQKSFELLNKGLELLNYENYNEAIEQFNASALLNNNSADVFLNRAFAYMKTGKHNLAEADIETAMELAKGQSDIYYQAGNIYFSNNNYKRAIEYYDSSLVYNSTSEIPVDLDIVYFNMGNSYLELKSYSEAIENFNGCLSINPGRVAAYHNRGIAYRNLGQFEKACLDFSISKALGSNISSKFIDADCKTINIDSSQFVTTMSNIMDSSFQNDLLTGFGKENEIIVQDTIYLDSEGRITSRYLKKFYRIGTFDVSKRIFIGPFEDFYEDGNRMATGEYDSTGFKNGLFKSYNSNGMEISSGNYINDSLSGTWEYFYDDGQKEKIIEFDGQDFRIIEYFDDEGNNSITKGTGKYNGETGGGKLSFEFKEGSRTGKWTFKGTGIQLTEKYKDGNFVKGVFKQMGGVTPYQETMLTTSLFDPYLFDLIEQFGIGIGVYDQDYPYFKELPVRPKRTLAANEEYSNDSTGIWNIVEYEPEFPGGMKEFYHYVALNLRYPQEARSKKIEGKVNVQFIISEDGSVGELSVVKGIGGGCDEEALRVIKGSPKWIPGLHHGKPVKVRMNFPLTFTLGDSN